MRLAQPVTLFALSAAHPSSQTFFCVPRLRHLAICSPSGLFPARQKTPPTRTDVLVTKPFFRCSCRQPDNSPPPACAYLPACLAPYLESQVWFVQSGRVRSRCRALTYRLPVRAYGCANNSPSIIFLAVGLRRKNALSGESSIQVVFVVAVVVGGAMNAFSK